MQGKSALEQFEPADFASQAAARDPLQTRGRFAGASGAAFKAGAAFGLGFQRLHQGIQCLGERIAGFNHGRAFTGEGPRTLVRQIVEREAEFAGGLLQIGHRRLQQRQATSLRGRFGERVATEFSQLPETH